MDTLWQTIAVGLSLAGVLGRMSGPHEFYQCAWARIRGARNAAPRNPFASDIRRGQQAQLRSAFDVALAEELI